MADTAHLRITVQRVNISQRPHHGFGHGGSGTFYLAIVKGSRTVDCTPAATTRSLLDDELRYDAKVALHVRHHRGARSSQVQVQLFRGEPVHHKAYEANARSRAAAARQRRGSATSAASAASAASGGSNGGGGPFNHRGSVGGIVTSAVASVGSLFGLGHDRRGSSAAAAAAAGAPRPPPPTRSRAHQRSSRR